MMGSGALDKFDNTGQIQPEMPQADKLNGQIILIVLTGKTNRTVVAVPNQYRKTVQQQRSNVF